MLTYEELSEELNARGYERLDEVDGPGTYSVAGDTVDIFGAGMAAPVRVEFFGDDVDGLRRVVASTGQTIGEIDEAEIGPTREFNVSASNVAHMRKVLVRELATDQKVVDDVAAFDAGIAFDGMERYLPSLYSTLEQPVNHASGDTLVVLAEPRSLFDDASRRYDEIMARARSFGLNRIIGGAHFPSDVEAGRILAVACAVEMRNNPAFLADFAEAKRDVRAGLGLPQ